MKIKQKRLVVILGTADFSTSIAWKLNQSQKAYGEPEIIAPLVAQADGSLSRAEDFLAAHPETKIIVLQGLAFKDRLRETATHFISRGLQVIVICFPTNDQPLRRLEKQYHPLGVSVIGENLANLTSLLESTILHRLNPSGVTRRSEPVRQPPEAHDTRVVLQHLHRSASPQEIPPVQSIASLLGVRDTDLGDAFPDGTEETNHEPPELSLPSGSHTERQVRVSWALTPHVPTSINPEGTATLRKTPTFPLPETTIVADEATTSDREDNRTLIGRIERLENEQDQLRRKLEELQKQFAQEQTAVRLALEQAGDALLFAVSALRHIPMPDRSTGTTTPPPEPTVPQRENSTLTPSEGSLATSAALAPSRETPTETPARRKYNGKRGWSSTHPLFSPREQELLQFLRSRKNNIVHYKELVAQFVSLGNVTMLVSKIRTRAKINSLPDPIKTYHGIGLSAQD